MSVVTALYHHSVSAALLLYSFQTPLHLSLYNFTNLSFALFVIAFAVTNRVASDILAVSFLGAYAKSRKWNDQIGE